MSLTTVLYHHVLHDQLRRDWSDFLCCFPISLFLSFCLLRAETTSQFTVAGTVRMMSIGSTQQHRWSPREHCCPVLVASALRKMTSACWRCVSLHRRLSSVDVWGVILLLWILLVVVVVVVVLSLVVGWWWWWWLVGWLVGCCWCWTPLQVVSGDVLLLAGTEISGWGGGRKEGDYTYHCTFITITMNAFRWVAMWAIFMFH